MSRSDELAEPVATLEHAGDVQWAGFSPDGARILTFGAALEVWTSSGALVATVETHEEHVNTLVPSADGSRFVTASVDQTATVWDATGRAPTCGLGRLACEGVPGASQVFGADARA